MEKCLSVLCREDLGDVEGNQGIRFFCPKKVWMYLLIPNIPELAERGMALKARGIRDKLNSSDAGESWVCSVPGNEEFSLVECICILIWQSRSCYAQKKEYECSLYIYILYRSCPAFMIVEWVVLYILHLSTPRSLHQNSLLAGTLRTLATGSELGPLERSLAVVNWHP